MTAVPLTHANGTARPQLRSAVTQDRIAALADAMRGMLADPGSPEAQQELASVRSSCTDAEFEAAWSLVQPETPAASRQYDGPQTGARLLPLVAPLRQDPAPAVTPATQVPWRLRMPDGDTVITWAMTFVVSAVILFAAIVSYSHIHGLATAHLEDTVQSHLLPLSIDGVIAEASLVLLFAARHKLDTPWLARAMLWTGIVATLGANALVALPASWISPVANAVIGATLSAWPAAAFIASVELVMLLVRDVRSVAARGTGSSAGSDGDEDTDQDSDEDTDQDSEDDKGGDSGGGPKPRPRRGKDDPVSAMLRRHPDWDDDKIAAKCGVHKRTVSRRRKALEEAKAD